MAQVRRFRPDDERALYRVCLETGDAGHDATALHELAPAGVTAVGLDVPGADGFAKSPKPIINQVLDHVQNGSIVVLHMHGGDNAPYTAQAVTPIVQALQARGYQLVTVTQLVNRV